MIIENDHIWLFPRLAMQSSPVAYVSTINQYDEETLFLMILEKRHHHPLKKFLFVIVFISLHFLYY
jgi:hypothetical protein